MKQIYEMKGAGYSGREIARELGLARNTVLRYLKSPEAMRPKPRRPRGSKLDLYTEHIDGGWGKGWKTACLAAGDQGVGVRRQLHDLVGIREAASPTSPTRGDDAI